MRIFVKVNILILIFLSVLFAQTDFNITHVEAVHLTEYQLKRIDKQIDLFATEVTRGSSDQDPALIVVGHDGADGFRAVINARTARVMEIYKNGTVFYTWPGIKVVGHRGNVKHTPENTIPAFVKAIELGVDLIEMDVRQTKDGELVILHDITVNRTTDGHGNVFDMTLSEIKKLDAGSWFGDEFKGTRIPTLKEALDTIKDKALPDIDFKGGDPQILVELLRNEGLLGKITMYCGNWNLMKETLQIDNGFMVRPSVPVGFAGLPTVLDKVNPPIINIDWMQFSERLVRDVHLSGRASFVNAMSHDNAFGIGAMVNTMPDYIQTDEMEILMPLLRAKGYHK